MEGLSFATVLVGGGGIAAVAGIIGAVIQGLFGRTTDKAAAAAQLAESDKSKAEAAQIIANTAAAVTERFRVENEQVVAEMRRLRGAVETLTEKVDEALPLLEQAGHPQVASSLRLANRNLRDAL